MCTSRWIDHSKLTRLCTVLLRYLQRQVFAVCITKKILSGKKTYLSKVCDELEMKSLILNTHITYLQLAHINAPSMKPSGHTPLQKPRFQIPTALPLKYPRYFTLITGYPYRRRIIGFLCVLHFPSGAVEWVSTPQSAGEVSGCSRHRQPGRHPRLFSVSILC